MKREIYILCYDNGKKHIDLAKRLGDEDDFGTGISFLILGLEELIKYLVIRHSIIDKSLFSDNEIDKLFSSHKEKHKIIIEYLETTKSGFADRYVESVFNKAMNRPLSDELINIEKNRFKEFGSMVGVIENHLSDIEIDSFIQWLKLRADNLKNKGFYVDRKNKLNQLEKTELIAPNELNKEDFELALKFTDSFFKQITFSKDIDLTDDEFIDLMNSEM